MVHDNRILSYQVDFENEILTLKTQYNTDEIHEKTDVIFTGYLTHIFYNADKHSIIFDIEEYPLNSFLENEYELLEEQKNYCWPINYETTNDLINYFQSNTYKVFSVASSYGLYGYVLAKEMNVVVNKHTV